MLSLKMNRSALVLVALVAVWAAVSIGLWLTPTPPDACVTVSVGDPRTDTLIDRAISGGPCVIRVP